MTIRFLPVLFLKQLRDLITCFLSSGVGKVAPAQTSEEGPARKGESILREAGFHLVKTARIKKTCHPFTTTFPILKNFDGCVLEPILW
jgi:Zn-dependent M32 family carboxypeptidase